MLSQISFLRSNQTCKSNCCESSPLVSGIVFIVRWNDIIVLILLVLRVTCNAVVACCVAVVVVVSFAPFLETENLYSKYHDGNTPLVGSIFWFHCLSFDMLIVLIHFAFCVALSALLLGCCHIACLSVVPTPTSSTSSMASSTTAINIDYDNCCTQFPLYSCEIFNMNIVTLSHPSWPVNFNIVNFCHGHFLP